MNPPSTLVDEAKAESEQVERELAEASKKHDVSLIDPPAAAPLEQGAATQDEEPEGYQPKEPSKAELRAAEDVLRQLRDRAQDLGAEATIENLIAIVDIIPAFTCPMEWQGEEDEEYRDAPTIQEISSLLLRGCKNQLQISPRDVVCLWRNKEKWVDAAGNNIRGKTASFPTRVRFLTEGSLASIEINFHLFKTMNPRQKVFTVYHALRELDQEGKRVAPDFVGYLDELQLFGVQTFREHAQLAYSVKCGLDRELPHQLSLLEASAD